jgi:hypothetical protein
MRTECIMPESATADLIWLNKDLNWLNKKVSGLAPGSSMPQELAQLGDDHVSIELAAAIGT